MSVSLVAESMPVYVGDLASANRAPVTVSPDTPLSVAKTIMRDNNFSQLPVVEKGGGACGAIRWDGVVGLIRWKAIGVVRSPQDDAETVSKYMDAPIRAVARQTRLIDVARYVLEHDCILVRDNGRLSGVVTPYDLLMRGESEPIPKRTIRYASPLDALVAVSKRLGLYENIHSMESKEFFRQYSVGEIPDEVEYFDWASDYRDFLELRRIVADHTQNGDRSD